MHTPGPWIALPEEVDKSYIRIRGTRLGSRYKIANVIAPDYPGNEHESPQTRANAALIAAAPELLAACVVACEWIAAGPEGARVLAQLRRAIRAAKGGAA